MADIKDTPTHETASRAEETLDLKEQYRSLLERLDALEQRRISQSSIPPQTVKSRHLEESIEITTPVITGATINSPTINSPTINNLPSNIVVLTGSQTLYNKTIVNPGIGQNSWISASNYLWTGSAINLFPVQSTQAGSTGFLILINGHGDVALTQQAVYYVVFHYNGTLYTSQKLVGDAFTFDVSGGYLRVNSGSNNWVYSVTLIKNAI